MNNSSISAILKSLNKRELKNLREFICSPYYNKNKNVTALFDFLASQKNKDHCNLTNEEIHKHIFKNTQYNNENIKTIIYLLTRLAEKYLVTQSLENDTQEYNRRLLAVFNAKGLDSMFSKHLKQFQKSTAGGSNIELEDIYKKSELEKTIIDFYNRQNNEYQMYSHELKLSEYLIAAFMVDMFKQSNIFWRFSYLDKIKAHDFTTSFLNAVHLKKLFETFKQNKYPFTELLQLYYDMYRFLDEETKNINLDSIKKSLTSSTTVSNSEKFILTTILVNTLYYKNLKTGGEYNPELLEAFKLLLSMYEYSGEQYLRVNLFTSIIRLGVRLEEYLWTESFIEQYHTLVEPSVKENMFNYSNAFLAFAKKDYEKCLEYESKINYDNFQQRYYLRDLRLCSLFELGKFETALSLIDSYRHFIKNEKSYKPGMKQGYLLFLTFITDLIRLKLGLSRKNTGDLKYRLRDSQPMRKEWLVKKYEELS